MAVQIKLRRGTASQWSNSNPVLGQGEMGFESDTRKTKVGDGITNWVALNYTSEPSPVNSNIASLYVDFNSGDDSNSGISLAAPKRTIQAAINAAGPIVSRLARGTHGSVPAAVTIFVAAGEDEQSIQLSGPLMTPSSSDLEAYSYTNSTIRYSIDIVGADLTTIDTGVITAVGSADPLDPSPGASPGHGGRQQLVCSGALWTPNQFKGTIVKGLNSSGGVIYATCSGNTSNTLFVSRGVSFSVVSPNNVVTLTRPSTKIKKGTIFIGNGVMARLTNIEIDNTGVTSDFISSFTNNEGNTISRLDLDRCIVRLSQATPYEQAIVLGAHRDTVFFGRANHSLLYTDNLTRCSVFDVYYLNLGVSNSIGSKSATASSNQHNYVENSPYGAALVQANSFVNYLYNSTFNFGSAGGSLMLNGQTISSGCLVASSGMGIDCDATTNNRIEIQSVTVVGAQNGAIYVGVENVVVCGTLYVAGCANPVRIEPAGTFRLGTISGLNDNTGAQITQKAGSKVIVDSKPVSSLGCSTDLSIDGVSTSYAAAPLTGVKGSLFTTI